MAINYTHNTCKKIISMSKGINCMRCRANVTCFGICIDMHASFCACKVILLTQLLTVVL